MSNQIYKREVIGNKYNCGNFQVRDINQAAVESYSNNKTVTGATGVIGHYTQVVWADTYEVGCGYLLSNKGKWQETVSKETD